MAEGNRLPSLDNAPNLKTDGSFLKPTPKYILYLGKVLPASVFALLVVYCLRHIHSFSADSVAQVAAVAFTILIHVWKKNMMWSIAAGTLCYMLLIRI